MLRMRLPDRLRSLRDEHLSSPWILSRLLFERSSSVILVQPNRAVGRMLLIPREEMFNLNTRAVSNTCAAVLITSSVKMFVVVLRYSASVLLELSLLEEFHMQVIFVAKLSKVKRHDITHVSFSLLFEAKTFTICCSVKKLHSIRFFLTQGVVQETSMPCLTRCPT